MLKFLRYGHELDIFIKILSTRFRLNGISLFIWQITIYMGLPEIHNDRARS